MVKGKLSNVYALRLKPGEDFLLSLQAYCEEKEIKNGIILSAIGSLDGARFFDPKPLPEKKFGYGYGDPIELEGPIELVTADGMICHNDDGDVLLHIHCSFSDEEGKAYGGHLIEGNKALFTLDLVIGELEGIEMMRGYDEDLEVEIFSPQQAE